MRKCVSEGRKISEGGERVDDALCGDWRVADNYLEA